jgi:erythromycin esterase
MKLLLLLGLLITFDIHADTDLTLSEGPIISINASDDFTDLAEFGQDIQGKRIVYLDELTHGEHEVFALKSRIIKYLHQHHDFDVVLLESGLFDVHEIWKNTEQSLVNQGPGNIFYAYASDKAFQDLLAYIEQTRSSQSPLYLSGFDGRLSGEHSINSFISELHKTVSRELPTHKLLRDWRRYSRILQSSLKRQRLTIEEREAQAHIVENYELIDKLNEVSDSKTLDSPAYFAQLLKGVTRVFEVLHDLRRHDEHDLVMADNVQWMLNNVYRGKKVIIWGHYIHVNPLGFVKFRYDNLGSLLDKNYGSESFYVNFQGKSGSYKNYIDGSTVQLPILKEMHLSNRLLFNQSNGARYFNIEKLKAIKTVNQAKLFGHGYAPEFDIQVKDAPKHFDATFIVKQLSPSN